MSPAERVTEKLAQLAGYLAELRQHQGLSWEAFSSQRMLARGIERTLHLAIECALDAGNQLIALHRWRSPESNRDVFRVLAENGVISRELLTRCEGMAGFRNILVHEYAKVDPVVVFGVLKSGLPDLERLRERLAVFRGQPD